MNSTTKQGSTRFVQSMRKNAIIVMVLVIISLFPSCQKQRTVVSNDNVADSTLTVAYINKVYVKDPARAILLADSAQQTGAMPGWQADSLRAKMCLDGYYDLNQSITYALNALSNDSVQSNPQRHLNILTMITQIEVSLGRYSECIQFCDEGTALAQQLGDNHQASRLMLNAGYSMYFMKEKRKGLDYMLQARDRLARMRDFEPMRSLSYCYGQLMNCLWVDNTSEAIRYGKMREALLDSIEQHISPLPEGYLDTQRALTFSKMADFHALQKKFSEARAYEQKFLKTNLSKTARGNQLIFDYYCTIGNFPRIEQTYHQSLPYWAHKDTFCTRYASVLGMLTNAYQSQGMMQKALDYRTRQVRIKDSLLIRENENEALRLSAIYQTHDKEIALEKKRADARHYLLLAVAALTLFVLACAFAVYYYRQQVRIHRKNMLLISQMDALEQESKRKEQETESKKRETRSQKPESEPSLSSHPSPLPPHLSPLNPQPSPANPAATSTTSQRRTQLVQLFRQIIDEDEAYLQPDFSREKLQQMMNVSKNSLTPILHEALGDVANLSDYINSKRIAHACQLLRQQPQMTIDNIALESGFSTTRNFRRCFKNQTGMSPVEYRESMLADDTENAW